MGSFSGLRIGGSLVAALSSLVLLTGGQAAAAQPSDQQTTPSACVANETTGLDGYQPVAAQEYTGTIGENQLLIMTDVKEAAGGGISGTAIYWVNGNVWTGTFTGTVGSGTISVQGDITSEGWSFTFSGTTSCLLSQLKTTNFATSPDGGFSSTVQFTSTCYDPKAPGAAAACVAKQIRDGISQSLYLDPVPGQGVIPYFKGGGHGTDPGLFTAKNAPAGGLDCSGYTRIVYALVYGKDVLGSGAAANQAAELTRDPASGGNIGDIVYYPEIQSAGQDAHVGIVIGKNYMLDEPNSGGHTPHNLRVDRISTFGTLYRFYLPPKVSS